jgi:hypothetical protein
LGGAYDVDDALEAVRWTLATRAELYPILPGCRALRAIRTDEFSRTTGNTPALRVYFRILTDDLVELAWVEEAL